MDTVKRSTMQKIKIALLSLVGLIFLATPVSAAVLSIQSLPSYINTNSFKLSCTSNGGPVQFYVSKNGGAFIAFGSSIDTDSNPCVIQVDSSVVNDQTSYVFKANEVQSTSTIYDTNGPGNVSGYYKDGLGDGFRLHYHTPSDSDFDKVIIYRGDVSGFSADSSHEVATINSSANSDMTYEDHFGPLPGKTYYYVIRALDHAGNSSGLVGDSDTTVSSTTTTTTTGGGVLGTSTSGKVVQLPEEGDVLGGVVDGTPGPTNGETEGSTPAEEKTGALNWILTHKKISLGTLAALLLVYYFLRSRKK